MGERTKRRRKADCSFEAFEEKSNIGIRATNCEKFSCE